MCVCMCVRARLSPRYYLVAALQAWDIEFYANSLRKARNQAKGSVRPYLTLSNALRGLEELSRALFGVRLEPRRLEVRGCAAAGAMPVFTVARARSTGRPGRPWNRLESTPLAESSL